MVIDHRGLAVWQKAHKLTLEIYSVTKGFPKEETYGLTVQLRRAALAVATNLAEGGARRSRREYAQFAAIARGSASEVGYLLLVSKDLGYLDSQEFSELNDGYDHVSRMLTNLMKALHPRDS